MIVISDTSPICYLLLVEQIDLLPSLYQGIVIPETVEDELGASEPPPAVKSWIANPPSWLQVQPVEPLQDVQLGKLDPGERDAILLAERLQADLVILDDKAARGVAVERGLRIIGLLGVLKDAARAGLVDLEVAFVRLQEVGFWVAPNLLERLLMDT
ncbi:MAG: DUF3368 domain-containing protein [Coleofasciculaceae cyanobacterium SM2_3_26]|nr:DUF3368 domain-containing protein [Coleofasciculaceae cyanobacterium SM2_3_26]